MHVSWVMVTWGSNISLVIRQHDITLSSNVVIVAQFFKFDLSTPDFINSSKYVGVAKKIAKSTGLELLYRYYIFTWYYVEFHAMSVSERLSASASPLFRFLHENVPVTQIEAGIHRPLLPETQLRFTRRQTCYKNQGCT